MNAIKTLLGLTLLALALIPISIGALIETVFDRNEQTVETCKYRRNGNCGYYGNSCEEIKASRCNRKYEKTSRKDAGGEKR